MAATHRNNSSCPLQQFQALKRVFLASTLDFGVKSDLQLYTVLTNATWKEFIIFHLHSVPQSRIAHPQGCCVPTCLFSNYLSIYNQSVLRCSCQFNFANKSALKKRYDQVSRFWYAFFALYIFRRQNQ